MWGIVSPHNLFCMKKAVAIFLMGLYGFASVGATVNAHYCMGRLMAVNLWAGNTKVCTNCGMAKEKQHGCCHDEQRQVTMQPDYQLTATSFTFEAFSLPALLPPVVFYTNAQIKATIVAYAVNNAPPWPPGTKRNILYCSFLI
jgi:hypothetical protein